MKFGTEFAGAADGDLDGFADEFGAVFGGEERAAWEAGDLEDGANGPDAGDGSGVVGGVVEGAAFEGETGGAGWDGGGAAAFDEGRGAAELGRSDDTDDE